MFCFKCGTELPDNAKFCGKCGTNLTVPPEDNATVFMTGASTSVLEDNATVFMTSSSASVQEDNATVFMTADSNAPQEDKATEIITADDAAPSAVTGINTVTTTRRTDLLAEQATGTNSRLGSIFGTYKVLNVIGQGGGGIVYKAIHTRLEKEVVIKQIKNPTGSFNRNETDMLKGIKHSYLPQVLDFIEQDGEAYTVIDFISGSDIEKLVKSGRKFTAKEIIRISKQLCEAVTYLHSFNPPIVHSDIKPANVMLNDDGNICLIDFNVSLVFDKNSSAIGGTRGYAAPEQLGIPLEDIAQGKSLTIGTKTPIVNESTDIYSIGAFMYYMIIGENPSADYRSKSIAEIKPNVPDGLIQITAKAMSLNPADRYKSVSEMLSAIGNISKLDRRYKALKVQRAIFTVAAILLTCGFAALTVLGKHTLEVEHEEKYQGYVTQIQNSISDGDLASAEQIIGTASQFEPTRIEPYYNQSLIYYTRNDWEKCMAYPELALTDEISANENNKADFFAEMYGMAAESAFELEEYTRTIQLFTKAMEYSDENVEYYRDLTISYARLGDISNAENALKIAEERGISSDKLELMQGEISMSKGNTEEAYSSFVKAIEITDDDYIRFRSLLACDKAMQADPSTENAEKMAALLQANVNKVSAEYSDIVKEMLANQYTLAEKYEKAADIYSQLFKAEKLNYAMQKNYYNLLFSKLQDYTTCLELLSKMKFENPEDYWVDMNLTYVYISVENQKEQPERDYSAVVQSYESAQQLYSVFVKNGKSDPNMDNLTAAINELKSYGWID